MSIQPSKDLRSQAEKCAMEKATMTKEEKDTRAKEEEIRTMKSEIARMKILEERRTIERIEFESRSKSLTESWAVMSAKNEDAEFANSFYSKFYKEFNVTDILGGDFDRSIVFKAKNVFDCSVYAVKRIALKSRDEFKAQLSGVLQSMARLDHPGIIRFYSLWMEHPPLDWQRKADEKIVMNLESQNHKISQRDDSNYIYIQMQLCDNSLEEWLNDNITEESRSIPRMKSWFRQIVSAVAYIHDYGLIHRDLKPSNVLILDGEKLKICDIGITRVRMESNSSTETKQTVAFTNMYSSPEQMSPFSAYTSKTDVFALGLILAEMCVPMDYTAKLKVFSNYRTGIHSYDLAHLPEVEDAVDWMTCLIETERPDCREILESSFLTQNSTETSSPSFGGFGGGSPDYFSPSYSNASRAGTPSGRPHGRPRGSVMERYNQGIMPREGTRDYDILKRDGYL